MSFRIYYLSLDTKSKQSFAHRAGTTTNYIESHLLNRYKLPRPKLMINLANASQGQITLAELTNFFYNR